MKPLPPLLLAIGVITAIAATGYVFITGDQRMAPAITYTSITGEHIAASELRNKVYLVNFWATSCGSCVQEMPRLASLHHKMHTKGLTTIAVAMNYDPPNYVLAFAEKQRLPFKVVLDPMGTIAESFGRVRVTPTTFLVDQQGKIIFQKIGIPNFEKLEQLIDQTLQKQPSS